MFGRIFGTSRYIHDELQAINNYDVPEIDKVQMRIDLFNYYTPFKLAQRYLAIFITLTYVLTLILTIAYHYIGLDYAGVITIVGAFNLGMVMLAVVGFYFSGGAISAFKKDPISADARYPPKP